MNIQWKKLHANKYLLAIFGLVIGAGILSVVSAKQAGAEWDFPGLWDQVQNHEGRLTNAEEDIKDIQESTGTPPSSNHVEVSLPPATTPSRDSVQESEPTVQNEEPAPVAMSRAYKSARCTDAGKYQEFYVHEYSDGSKQETSSPREGVKYTDYSYQVGCASTGTSF